MMRRTLVIVLALTTVTLGSVLGSGCSSSSEEAAPSRPPVPPVVTNPDASLTPEGGAGDAAGCSGANGCFSCEPSALEQFLNACTDGQCTPFDNVKRLPLYKPGQALPSVP